MGLEASLKLLDLSPEATIEDANQAYTYLHQMIDLFHKDAANADGGSRQEDMELLTCAYEKAVACLSDRSSSPGTRSAAASPSSTESVTNPTDLHFTINFSGSGKGDTEQQTDSPRPEPDDSTVEDAISITERRVRRTEKDLPDAQADVNAAVSQVEAAGRKLVRAKQTRINAVVAAKSAKSRAVLLEIEAQRTMEEAIAAAEKARDRVVAARQAASQARQEAETARREAARVRQSEKTAAAEMVCAEDRLDRKKARLQALTHTLLQARNQMKLFQTTGEATPLFREDTLAPPADRPTDDQDADRQRVLSDLLEIEASLQTRKQPSVSAGNGTGSSSNPAETDVERRRFPRIAYPSDRFPVLTVGGRSIPVLDVSNAGLRLKAEDDPDGLHLVRGTMVLGDGQSVRVAGKVVRKDDEGLGVKLVTRIGQRILDQERLRLRA